MFQNHFINVKNVELNEIPFLGIFLYFLTFEFVLFSQLYFCESVYT